MKMEAVTIASAIDSMPIVAILRGVRPEEAVAIGEALVAAGVVLIEVPLNSPEPLESIARLATALGDRAVVGAGTVLSPADLDAVADAGGRIAVTPNSDPAVIARARARGVEPMPGFFTATEAFAAISAGARYLKLFPASTAGLGHLPALRAVIPAEVKLLAVGGIGPSNAAEWLARGADGLGIGSDIYRPGDSADQVAVKAARIVGAVRSA